jgi:2-polyprenyl-3-methyl-5-hydroxy-6-metoxy-1,4-benzoquinol methylase
MSRNIRKLVKEGYEKGDYAVRFRSSSQLNALEKRFIDRMTALIPAAAKILDLGCGTGIPFAKYLAGKGFRITGIDFASKHIAAARMNVSEATFIENDFSKLDFGSERFHAIIAMYSIFHIPRGEQNTLFSKMHNLLQRGGVVLMTLGTSSTEEQSENWAGASMAWSSFDTAAYEAMIAMAGFEIIESEYEGQPGEEEYHWWVLAKRK